MMPRQTWTRAFKPRFSGEVHEISVVKGGTVTDTAGKTYPTKLVTPVAKESETIATPDLRGRTLRDKHNADALRRYAEELHKELIKQGVSEVSLTTLSQMLGEDFHSARRNLRMGEFVKLYPGLFKWTGEAQKMKVTAIRHRLRVKTRM